ncbi:MgtC/SapB family protein [Marilutibacter maris]|uniref:Uncharacterized protein n=1 Tax=Marilutibacter maris TaxID=1605891 RepID=A0A2U9T8Z9_9GAMM|nr:DUF4010 domain-containing protein [Lysobacter maris]AWV07028.1 hypothetical protein C9I47_1324 [Lysobacter maris]
MNPSLSAQGLLTAISIGLLIGVIRERHHAPDDIAVAGVRTHTLAATAAAVAIVIGPAVFVVLLLAISAYAIAGYLHTRETDPGLTGEVALLVTPLLAALAQLSPPWAGGLAVVAALLLFAKRPLQGFARRWLAEQELQDGLMLAAAALVILPLLPDKPIDPWGVLVPSALWRIVVLVMGVGMIGHLALRLVGARWGLPIAGFFSGFASSTAAVAGFGQQARQDPAHVAPAASAALLANLASLLLFAGVVGTVSPTLLRASLWPLLGAGLALLVSAAWGLLDRDGVEALPSAPSARAFKIGQALLLGLLISAVLLLSAWLRSLFGDAGALVAAMLVALAELHAAAASVAQLAQGDGMTLEHARLGLAGLLLASALAKGVLAVASGPRGYALQVAGGLAAMAAAALLLTWLAG